MSEELKELLDDLNKWVDSPLDEIDKKYGVWELNVNQSKELLDYINSLKQALIDIRELIKKDSIEIDGKYTEVCCSGENFLQIIDKVLDSDKVRGNK